MASKKARGIAIGAAVLVLGGVVAFNVTKESRNRIPVQTQKVGRRDLVSIVSASGEIKPKKSVNISSNAMGRIIRMPVKEGDRVKQGDLLISLESIQTAADGQKVLGKCERLDAASCARCWNDAPHRRWI